MNYRSVVIFGSATLVENPNQKREALKAFTEQIIPGRWPEIRQPSPQELRGTLVLCVPLTEASAKLRTGPPLDDQADYSLPVWAGVIPLQQVAAAPIPDPQLPSNTPLPEYVQNYRR